MPFQTQVLVLNVKFKTVPLGDPRKSLVSLQKPSMDGALSTSTCQHKESTRQLSKTDSCVRKGGKDNGKYNLLYVLQTVPYFKNRDSYLNLTCLKQAKYLILHGTALLLLITEALVLCC